MFATEEKTNTAALILNYNTPELTLKCVNNLLDIADDLIIVIVDNNSTDNSLLEFHQEYNSIDCVHIVENTDNSGYAKGNNAGLKYIREKYPDIKYVMILNPDIIVNRKTTISALKETLESNESYAIATCQVILNDQPLNISNFAWRFPDHKHLLWAGTFLGKFLLDNPNYLYQSLEAKDNIAEVDVVSGCFFMAKIEELSKVGDFDERTFLYFEETILAKRLAKINKREIILLTKQVNHNHQYKDENLRNYKKRLFDRKCFHNSKMVYIEHYSDIHGFALAVSKIINKIDYGIKALLYGKIMALFQRG